MTVPPRKQPGDPLFFQWTCHVCEADIGVATSAAVWVLQGIFKDVETRRVKRSAAGKSLVCAHCMARGKITMIEAGDN